jgi:hypothetical protein
MKTDWMAVQEHLDYLGLDPAETPVVFAAWEKGACRHFTKNGRPISREVDALLAQHPGRSLGLIVNPGGTKKAEITSAVALFTEDDSGASLEQQMTSWEGVMPEPSLSVFTGNKSIHHYWVLSEPITPDQFTVLQRRLAAVMQAANPGGDADSSLDDPCQVMRVAGAIHPKTGKAAEIRHASAERFRPEELTDAIAQAEQRFNIQPSTTVAINRRNPVAAASAGSGTHYKHLTAAQRHGVVIDALKHCPERGKEGTGSYPTAMRILAALVHEFGAAVACDLAKQANWSQDSDWDIDKVADSLEASPPAAGRRSKIWTVFTIAAEDPADPDDPWICPWQSEETSETSIQPAMPGAAPAALDTLDPGNPEETILQFIGEGWYLTEKGHKHATPLNAGSALTLLRKQLPPASVRLNLVTGLIEVNGVPIEEADLCTFYAEAQARGWEVYDKACGDALLRIARQYRYDPIQDYLNFVAAAPDIDPVDINSISTTYLETTNPAFDLYMKAALLGAVKRRFEPGCQFDTVTTLDGDGRIGKSAVWIALASPDWHTSSDAESEKDFLLILHQAWIYEQAELDYLTSKKAAGQLKNLITTRKDTVRAPYGKGMENRPRAGIMAATVNGPFLQGDPALRARFLVILCPQSFEKGERINVDRIAADRDRIWKAAVLAYRNGEAAHLSPEDLAAASRFNLISSEHEHPWVDAIERWLQQPINAQGPHTSNEILIGAGLRSLDRIVRADQNELARAMQQIGGWDKDRQPTWHQGQKSRFWRRISAIEP